MIDFLDQSSVVSHVVAIAPLVIKHAKSNFEFILEFYDPIKIRKQHLAAGLPRLSGHVPFQSGVKYLIVLAIRIHYKSLVGKRNVLAEWSSRSTRQDRIEILGPLKTLN